MKFAVFAFLLIFALSVFAGGLSLVEPLFPPNAAGGGTVVAELELAAGAVKNVEILSGEEPFTGSCKPALAQWVLPQEQGERALIVVHFRTPQLYSVGSSRQVVDPAKTAVSLPYPKFVTSPAYPANAMARGSVVLRADVSAEGQVVDVRPIKSLAAVTETSMDAVREWEFVPATDSRGKQVASHAYIVLVFRFPVLAK